MVMRVGARTANGTPSKCTPRVIALAAKMLSVGNYRVAVAARLGITEETFANWMKWGAAGREPYLGFFTAVRDAEAKAETNAVGTWYGHGLHDYRALKDLLARRFPERWGPLPEEPAAPSVNLLLVQLLQQKGDMEVLDLVGQAKDVKALLPMPEPTNGQSRKKGNGRARR